jgi:hypothetical protein
MSVLGRYKQQPGEKRKRGIDYESFLETNEEISTVTAAVSPTTDDPLLVSTIVIDPDGKNFAYFVEGGEDATDYTVTFTVTTSLGQRREDEVEFEIEEV